MSGHAETFVRVNARVDRGVVELVSALSAIPELETIESCENANGVAFVLFTLGEWDRCGKFLFRGLLPTLEDNLRAVTCASIEGYGSGYLGRLACPPEAVSGLAAAVMNVHRYGCCGDS